MRFLSILILTLAIALQAQTADRLRWGPFTSSADSVTGIGIRGALSTKAGCVTRVTLDGEDVECASPTGTGAPVNQHGSVLTGKTVMDTAQISTLLASDTSSFKPEMTADTLNVTDRATFDYATASTDAVFDANKRLVSNAVTGTGNSVRAQGATIDSATLTGRLTATSAISGGIESYSAVTSGTSSRRNAWAFGAGVYVEVGEGGLIRSGPSMDALVTRTSGTSNGLNFVIWDAFTAKFWAVGETGTMLSSADGVTWAAVSLPAGVATNNLTGIASNQAGTFVVSNSSSSSNQLVSTDGAGVTWSPSNCGGSGGGFAVHFDGTNFLIGRNTDGSNRIVTYSSDVAGGAWAAATIAGGADIVFSVTSDSGVRIITGNNGFVATSPLSMSPATANWTVRSVGVTNSLRSFFANSHAYIISSIGACFVSTDNGVTWQAGPSSGVSSFLRFGMADPNNPTRAYLVGDAGVTLVGAYNLGTSLVGVDTSGVIRPASNVSGYYNFTGQLSNQMLSGSGTRLVTSTSTGSIGNVTSIAGAYTWSGAQILQNTLAVTGVITGSNVVNGLRFVSGVGRSVMDTLQVDVLDAGEIIGTGLFDSMDVNGPIVMNHLTANTPLYLDGAKEVKSGSWSGTGTEFALTQGATMSNLTATGTLTAGRVEASDTVVASVGLRTPRINIDGGTLHIGGTTLFQHAFVNDTLTAAVFTFGKAIGVTLNADTVRANVLSGAERVYFDPSITVSADTSFAVINPQYTASTASNVIALDIQPYFNSGALDTSSAIRILGDNGLGGPSVSIGLYIPDVGDGGASQWAIRTGADPVYFGGRLKVLGTTEIGDSLYMGGKVAAYTDGPNLYIGQGFADGGNLYIGSTVGNADGVYIVDPKGLNVRKIFGDTTEIATGVTTIGPGRSTSGSKVTVDAEAANFRGNNVVIGATYGTSGSGVTIQSEAVQINPGGAAAIEVLNTSGTTTIEGSNLSLILSGNLSIGGTPGVTGTCSSVTVVKGIVTGCTP